MEPSFLDDRLAWLVLESQNSVLYQRKRSMSTSRPSVSATSSLGLRLGWLTSGPEDGLEVSEDRNNFSESVVVDHVWLICLGTTWEDLFIMGQL